MNQHDRERWAASPRVICAIFPQSIFQNEGSMQHTLEKAPMGVATSFLVLSKGLKKDTGPVRAARILSPAMAWNEKCWVSPAPSFRSPCGWCFYGRALSLWFQGADLILDSSMVLGMAPGLSESSIFICTMTEYVWGLFWFQDSSYVHFWQNEGRKRKRNNI